MSARFSVDFSIKVTCPIKMLHFDQNPNKFGHLVAEIPQISLT